MAAAEDAAPPISGPKNRAPTADQTATKTPPGGCFG